MTQSGVSQHIRKLEEQLDTDLLIRQGKQFSLTNAGEQLYREAGEILQRLSNLEQRIGEDPPYEGLVRLMSPGSVGLKLYPQLLTLQQQHPNLIIDYRFAPNSDIERALVNHEIDIGLMTDISDDVTVSCTPMAQEALVLITPAATAAPSWEQLAEEFYIPVLKLIEDNWRERTEDFRVLKNLATEHTSLDSFLENLALDPPNDSVAVMESADDGQSTDKVTISTIHSAKGLEWPVVFVNSLVDGITPHHRSLDDFEALEEERKLFYVACSRAKTQLYLTAPNYFSSYSGYFDMASRFIAELSADEVTVETVKSPIKENDDPIWW